MPRPRRFCPGGLPVHVILRGHNRQICFTADSDIATYARSSGLFENRFKSSLAQEETYLVTCLRYIELNSVRAGMVADPDDYRWSNYSRHAFGDQPILWTPHDLYTSLGATPAERQNAYRALTSETLGADVVANSHHCANKGLILDTEQFRKQFANLTGDRAYQVG